MNNKFPTTTRELIDYKGQAFYEWQAERQASLGYGDDDDQARFGRIMDAAEDCADGSTHSEHIDDMREYAEIIHDEATRRAQSDEEAEVLDRAMQALVADLDRLEAWHEANGSLHQAVG